MSVFLVSTIFCEQQPSQCFSWAKAASLIVVVIAVLMYSHATSLREPAKSLKKKASVISPEEESQQLDQLLDTPLSPANRQRRTSVTERSEVDKKEKITASISPKKSGWGMFAFQNGPWSGYTGFSVQSTNGVTRTRMPVPI